MVSKDVMVECENGLHARPAASFAFAAAQFESEVTIAKSESQDLGVNAKSVISVLSLGVRKNESVKLTAIGSDEEKAIRELTMFLRNN
ncbi:MAG TPA: HPr family phosphocarrier protein [Bacillota bacterium]|nr:HPr family phosphocarrier protein [Bacillota bacterium]HPF42166.1 HPr family phosphocarrier protein [Bacillota bacterium]HPJ85671.1 HPr family phosphocarrier protein [Bacillota bacterium]